MRAWGVKLDEEASQYVGLEARDSIQQMASRTEAMGRRRKATLLLRHFSKETLFTPPKQGIPATEGRYVSLFHASAVIISCGAKI